LTEIRLIPRPPFDFSKSASIFSTGDADIRIFLGGVFRQVLLTAGGPVQVEVRSRGTLEKPELTLTLSSDPPVTVAISEEVRDRISMIFSIADDLSPFYTAVAGDPIISDITHQLRGVKAPVTPTVFEALTDSIIEQQISLKAARSIENRLIRLTGKQIMCEGTTRYCYPEPSVLAEIPDSGYRSCGLTTRKGEYIRDISRQIVSGDLDVEAYRKFADTESIITEMVKIRGVGRWTAELTLLRGLHRMDAFPADDVAVRRFISRFYLGGEKVSSADARHFAQRWGDYKGLAAYYLEVADHLGIQPRPSG